MDAFAEEGAGIFPPGPPGGEAVLDHPLAVGLTDDRPAVVDADLVPQPGSIDVVGLRRDPVDHRVREGAAFEEAGEIDAFAFSHRHDCRANDIAVAGQVVAAEDREWPGVREASRFEAGDNRLDRGVAVRQRVAALGDRH